MKKKRKLGKKLLSFLLTLAMVVGLMPGMGLTAYAATYDSNPYASLVNTTTTVKFNDIDWYIIKDESTAVDVGTVTLFAKEMIGGSMFHSESNAYSTSTVKSYLDGLTTEGKAFAGVADAIETVKVKGSDSDNEVDAKLWLLSTEEASSLKAVILLCSHEEYDYWWLRSPGTDDQHGVSVCGEDAYFDDMTNKDSTRGVRPALKLDLSKVTFDSASKTFSLTAYAGSPSTYTIKLFSPIFGELEYVSDATLPFTFTGQDVFNLYDQLGGWTASSVSLTSGSNISVSGLNITVNDEGSSTIAVYDGSDSVSFDVSVTKNVAHTHDFTYSATGATITATCSADGCTLPPSSEGGTDHVATLTIAAPTLETYGQTGDGISAEATITDANSIKGDATVTYKKGDETLGSAPTNAGTYTASITVGGATASVEYTIAQKEVTVSGITASDKVYDGNTDATLVTTAATITGKLNGDTLTVTGGTGTFDNANVGENKTVTISNLTLDGTSKDNYKLASAGQQTTATAKITAKEVGLTWSDTELAYTGEAQKPTATATGVVNGDTCTVTVSGEQTNVGDDYTATAASLSNSNYRLPENKTTTFKIVKANAVPATVTANNRTYDGTDKPLVTVTGEATGGEMQYALGTATEATGSYTTSIPTKTDAGTYYVYYKVIGDDNHEDSQPVCITVMIAPAYAVITKDPSDAKVIRGSRVTFRIAATGENVTYRWETSKDNGETWVKSNADGADTDKIVFKATESLDGRLYRCVAITDAGEVFSASAQLTTLPVISSQPRNAAAAIGSVASFTVKARSSVAKYQWQVSLDGGATWKKSGSEGAETATVNITVYGAKYNGYLFRCKVTNGTWTEYSKEVKLSVKTAIVKQPEDVSEYYGNLVKLYVKATGVNPQYQWQVKNASGKWVNSTSAGNNTNILAFTSRASLDGRQFRCKITDENGTVYSNIITFTAVEK